MTKIKICGLTRLCDIEAVNHAKPDYIGFVFAPSRRRIAAETALELKRHLDSSIKAVGVFVNQPVDEIVALCRMGAIDMIQLHGTEDAAFRAEIRKRTACPIIQAVRVVESLPVLPTDADFLLFDSGAGSGIPFDWNFLPDRGVQSYFLAGGLHIENVQSAIKQRKPYCIDLSSGAEIDGVKSAVKIDALVKLVRTAG